MTVLHLDGGRDWRGGQIQTATLMRGLAARGVNQRILARADGFSSLEPGPYRAASILSAARGADLVHAHDARSHSLAALLLPAKPLVVSRRVAFSIGIGWTHRWKYRRPQLYLAVSEYVAAELRRVGVPAERIRVVHDGTAPTEAPLNRVEPGAGAVALASDDPGKGSALAAESCRLAGLPLQFTVNLERDLPRAGIFLYLSRMEGLGSALILAGLHAKPIVASDIGGIPEVVRHERTGLLTANDPGAVAAALRRFVEDPSLARECGEAARAQAQARFSDDRMVEQTLAAYQEVLRRAGTAS